MTSQNQNREYLERRQRESAERAESATDAGIARVHRQFADHYADRLRNLSSDQTVGMR